MNQGKDRSNSPPAKKSLKRQEKQYIGISSFAIVFCIGIFFIGWLYLIAQAQEGKAGTEIVFLGMMPLLLVPFIIALINTVVFTLLLFKRSMPTNWRVAIITLLFPLIIIAGLGIYTFIAGTIATYNFQQEQAQDAEKSRIQYEKDLKIMEPKTISVEEATSLLNTCKIFGFYYTEQNDDVNAEASTTGILSVELPRTSTYRIHIAQQQEATMIPIARNAQKICNGQPQFWHDGLYE